MNNNFYYTRYDPEEQRINQMLEELAQRMIDGTTTDDDLFMMTKHSEVLKHKIRTQTEWNRLKATVDNKPPALKDKSGRPMPKC